ncbi:MAG: zinc-dependent metalloprotease [Planctomycetota bacterium]|jgi:hypothetical protein
MHRAVSGSLAVALAVTVLALPVDAQLKPATKKKSFEDVSKGYRKVVSTADGRSSLYTVWVDDDKNQVLAELPRGYDRQRHLIAMTQASGGLFAGLQGPTRYVYWRKYGDRVALIQPELGTRSQGEAESRSSVKRLFTDRVVLDIPIVTTGPGGQPVIDIDDLLVKNGGRLGLRGSVNSRLLTVKKAKAFPENIELAFEVPVANGTLSTFHFSISRVPDKTGYKPRVADERVGYFTTVFRDLGEYREDDKWVRYIDRWHLEKRDPKLKLSPPKEPVVFYLEHTVPVRYRRWVREGIEYWNNAFRKVGLDGAIQVRIQDKATGAHMEKDPEDVRYNFIRWLNNDISTAIGPHRSHPLTGQILDADVVLTDGWIRAYWRWYSLEMPSIAMQSFTPETLLWLEDYPEWDPRLQLVAPEQREHLLAERARRKAAGELPPLGDPVIGQNADLAAIHEWTHDGHGQCLAAHGKAFDMALGRLHFETMDLTGFEPAVEGMSDVLDGIPEWFVGPFLAELTCHEVGHTLGLRHNFKASSIYTLEQINSEEWKGKKPLAGSVMDYLPANFNLEAGDVQGDFAMIDIGPYDYWAIEYGYTFDDPAKVLERVSDPQLAYLTDDDTRGPDPLARRYDLGADPLDYAENMMRIVRQHRGELLERFVKDGQSWSKARGGYQLTLSMQTRSLSMMANWLGGSYVNRDRKGDPGARIPVTVVEPEKQRKALEFVIENAMSDEAFGLSPELLQYMTVDKWSDQSPGDRTDPTWPVHDRVAGLQASVLTMVMNPTTLKRTLDNEYRTVGGEDALTLPELLDAMVEACYGELDTSLNGETFTNRDPMISSLRRNLQSNMTDRLIALSADDRRMPRPIRTLTRQHLRELDDKLETLLAKKDDGQIDDYTLAHLTDLHDRITKALNRVYVDTK